MIGWVLLVLGLGLIAGAILDHLNAVARHSERQIDAAASHRRLMRELHRYDGRR